MKPIKPQNLSMVLPILFFAVVIIVGAIFLHMAEAKETDALSWTDAFFTSTSAACVTGLIVVDTGSYFTLFGKVIVLALIQIGGLGIMTFASLSIYLWRRKTTISDRITVGQVLTQDTGFNLGKFLMEIVAWTFAIELAGAVFLYMLSPAAFSPFSALFHSVSAFCNAGFSLFSDSLMAWKGNWGINLVFILLIFFGGIGFSVFVEVRTRALKIFTPRNKRTARRYVSWNARVVIRTSLLLILIGWLAIFISEYVGYNRMVAPDDMVLTALFQSVTCRTAGFNTLDIGAMTNVSLVILLVLMFIGGAPGSCAGGIKVTTFRVLIAAIWSELSGKSQTVIGRFAVNEEAVKKAMVLFVLAILIIFTTVFLLDFTEGGDKPHQLVRGQYLEILFESVSAFSTVGLSTGITPTLSAPGKWFIIVLMFVGRLGPFLLIGALQRFQKLQHYKLPEENLMIG